MTKITKVSVFDMDGTFIDTPMPDVGKVIYKEKTGNDWPYKGWWGRKESLNIDMFDMPIIKSTFKDYEREMAREDTMVILMTGRMIKLIDEVNKILLVKNVTFDGIYLNTGGETGAVKMKQLERLFSQNPDIREIILWDDRDAHIQRFKDWGEEMIIKDVIDKFHINHVVSDNHNLTP